MCGIPPAAILVDHILAVDGECYTVQVETCYGPCGEHVAYRVMRADGQSLGRIYCEACEVTAGEMVRYWLADYLGECHVHGCSVLPAAGEVSAIRLLLTPPSPKRGARFHIRKPSREPAL